MKCQGNSLKLRTTALLPLVLALLATAPVCAQVYKWVDERGVTNYSGEPPKDAKGKSKARIVEDTLSVYTPPTAVTQAIEDAREHRKSPLAEKVDDLERQLEAERRARQIAANAAAEAQAAAADAASGQIVNGTWYPPGVIIAPRGHHRHRVLPQARLKSGTTAGNVVGPGGYIPGNSAAARPVGPRVHPRRPSELSR